MKMILGVAIGEVAFRCAQSNFLTTTVTLYGMCHLVITKLTMSISAYGIMPRLSRGGMVCISVMSSSAWLAPRGSSNEEPHQR